MRAEAAPSEHQPAPRVGYLAVFAAALAVRAWSFWLHGHARPFTKYVQGAEALAAGGLSGSRVLDFSTLYLEFHRLCHALGLSPQAIAAFQCGVGALSCVLIAAIAVRWLGPRAGLLAGALAALHREAIVYDQLLEPEVFLLFFSVLAVWLGQLRERQPLGALGAGVCVGLAIATRPSAWVLLPGVLLLTLLGDTLRLRRPVRRGVAFALGLALCQLGAASRDAAFAEGPAMSPWQVFYTGNNSLASGLWREDFLVKDLERQQAYESPDLAHQVFREVAVAAGASAEAPDVYWRSISLRFLERYPSRALALFGQKLLALGQPYAATDFPQADVLQRSLEPWPLWPHWLAFAFGATGLLLHRRLWPAAVLLASASAVFVVFFVSNRYRLTLSPWLNIGSAAFVTLAVGRLAAVRDGRLARRQLLLPAGAALLLAGVLLAPLPPGHLARQRVMQVRALQGPFGEALALVREERLPDASRKLGDALYAIPWETHKFPIAGVPFDLAEIARARIARARETAEQSGRAWDWLRYACLLDFAGREQAALDAYEEVRARASTLAEGRLTYEANVRTGVLLLARDRRDPARAAFSAAAGQLPGAPEALAGLALASPEAERGEIVEQALAVNEGFEVRYHLGRTALDAGRPADALEPLRALTTGLPQYARGRLLYAIALHRTGSEAEAREQALRAERDDPLLFDPVYTPLGILRGHAERNPGERNPWLRLARSAARYGRYDLAMRAWRQIEARFELSTEDAMRIGQLSLRHGRPENALTYLEEAARREPGNAAVRNLLERARARPSGGSAS